MVSALVERDNCGGRPIRCSSSCASCGPESVNESDGPSCPQPGEQTWRRAIFDGPSAPKALRDTAPPCCTTWASSCASNRSPGALDGSYRPGAKCTSVPVVKASAATCRGSSLEACTRTSANEAPNPCSMRDSVACGKGHAPTRLLDPVRELAADLTAGQAHLGRRRSTVVVVMVVMLRSGMAPDASRLAVTHPRRTRLIIGQAAQDPHHLVGGVIRLRLQRIVSRPDRQLALHDDRPRRIGPLLDDRNLVEISEPHHRLLVTHARHRASRQRTSHVSPRCVLGLEAGARPPKVRVASRARIGGVSHLGILPVWLR